MARITASRITRRVLGVDDNGNSLPIGVWGTVHNLSPSEAEADRNASPFGPECGVVSLIAIGGNAHFVQGDEDVEATVNDPILPSGVWIDALVPLGDQWDYVSVISAVGSGPIAVQICERTV